MTWIIIAIISHFLAALVYIVDKYILARADFSPVSYSFYIGILGGLVALLMPFGFGILPGLQIFIAFSAGLFFIFGNLCFYKSIQANEVSRIVPVIGGAVPFGTLVLAYFFLGERLVADQLLAFLFLVGGTLIMLWQKKRDGAGMISFVLNKKFAIAILSAFLFSASFVATKYTYNHQPFLNGFIWTRLGGVLAACLFLLWPKNRREIFKKDAKTTRTGSIGLIAGNKTLSALAYVLLSYAVFLGDVALVNALQAVQYVFLLLIALIFSRWFPKLLKEQTNKKLILQKVAGIIFIGIGLVILTV